LFISVTKTLKPYQGLKQLIRRQTTRPEHRHQNLKTLLGIETENSNILMRQQRL